MHYAFGAVNKLRLNAHPKAAELDVQARPADEVDTSKGSFIKLLNDYLSTTAYALVHYETIL